MSSSEVRQRLAALRAEARAVGELVAAEAAAMDAEELFEATGQLQGVLNSVEGAQLVAVAHAASHQTRLTDRGPVHVHHSVGFVDEMAGTEVSLATGLGQWAAGRKVAFAAALAERFPRLLRTVLTGGLPTSTVAKVVSVCDGMDVDACEVVEAVLADRLPGLDPARVTTLTRRVATRVTGDQVRVAHARNRRERCVEVSPGPEGTTTWWASLPTDRSAAAWAAITTLGDRYTTKDPSLTTDQARADALLDLILTNVDVTTTVTLGIPVITPTTPSTDEANPAGTATANPAGTATAEGETDGSEYLAPAVGGLGLGPHFSVAAALSGCEIPGLGVIDADTVHALLEAVPLHVGRALLDSRTGTLLETTSTAYRPPRALADFVTTRDSTCRMWGCTRPATRCDLDHGRPWPTGATTPTNLAPLCRRHHRLKQRRRWTYQLQPDGTATWTSPSGITRTTLPDHAPWPPPEPAPPPLAHPAAPEHPARALVSVDPPPF